MSLFENNGFFWQKLDTLLLSNPVIIKKKKGDLHADFGSLIYPVDYGELGGTNGNGDSVVSVYCGTAIKQQANTVVVAVDILKKTLDVKVLLSCTPEEELLVLKFLNQTDFQKTIVMRRSIDVPNWAKTV